MRPLPPNKKQKKQQSILGFFDVPDSVHVAVQRKTAKKRKKPNNTNNDEVKRTKNGTVSTSSTGNSNNAVEAAPAPASAEVALLADKTINARESSSLSTKKAEIVDPQEKTDMRGLGLDFQSTLCISPRNIVQQLHERATLGLARKILRQPPTTPCWSNASWLKLSCPQSGNALTQACILEWDPMGVLLAVMAPDDSLLRIYDWDTVSVTNAKGRNHRLRRKTNPQDLHTGGSYRIETTLRTNVRLCGKMVRKLAWNPFDPDQIALLDR